MSTQIQWTDETWNPVAGCRRVSPGCFNCYAERTAHRLASAPSAKTRATYADLTHIVNGRPAWTGVFRELSDRLNEPFHWRDPRRVFVNSMSDLFGEGISDGYIARVWDVMGRTPRHSYQILTKRPERMRDWVTRWADQQEPEDLALVRGPVATRERHLSGRGQLFAAMLESMGEPPPGYTYPTFDWCEGQKWWPRVLPNVWLGTSVEDQQAADTRIPPLLSTPAAVRFLSCEPLLGPVDLRHIQHDSTVEIDALTGDHGVIRPLRGRSEARIDWVIAGAESGPGARPMETAWAQEIKDQCKAANPPVAFFFKQQADSHGRKIHLPELDGRQWTEYPA